MKTIEYDPIDYEIIDTINFDEDLIQKVKFKSGYYGVAYHVTENNVTDIMLIGTDKGEAYVDLFLAFARSQTEVINKIHEKVDKVHLVVQLNNEQSEIFEQLISKEEANDLLERLKIANELVEIREANRFDSFPVLSVVLLVCILLNFASILYHLGVVRL